MIANPPDAPPGCVARRGGAMTAPMVLPLTPVARYRVLFADCDPMRIVYYASYFRLFEIGRAELFRGLGHCFADYVARGLYLARVSAAAPTRIVSSASYFRLFEIGRAELFRGLGHCFADYVARGLYLAVVSASC